MGLNLATAWEAVADAIGDEQALISGHTIRTWRDFDDRGARIAAALAACGIGIGDNVGLCLFNANEYSEAQFAAMKLRASPFNINYRYTAEELATLLADADARAVFYPAALRDRFVQIAADLPDVRCWIEVDGEPDEPVPAFALGYDALIAAHEPAPRIERSGDDLWLLFTGGTTGNPKGVMWPHESIIGTMAGTYEAMKLAMPTTVDEVVARVLAIRERGYVTRQLAAAPLMHGTSGITALSTLLQGGCVLTLPGQHFDADALFACVQDHRATHLTIVGDAFTRPMIDALRAAVDRGEPYDLSSIFLVMSSGVMWSASMKAALFEFNPKMKLLDSLGSSEGVGFARKLEGDAETASTARFSLGPDTIVITEDGRRVGAGSGEKGRLALGGHLPLGYYKDPVKSAETFPVIDGKRYSIPGDWATVEADGTIVLLGRGSVCINTGGEKVYPEEVEEALKLVPDIVDANVVGVPDERWGQAVTAVVQLRDGASIDDDAITSVVKEHLAGYKAPKHIIRVPSLVRSSNGKSDYRWAGATAREALGIAD